MDQFLYYESEKEMILNLMIFEGQHVTITNCVEHLEKAEVIGDYSQASIIYFIYALLIDNIM